MISLEEAERNVRFLLEIHEKRSSKYVSDQEELIAERLDVTIAEIFALVSELVKQNEYAWLFGFNSKLFLETEISELACIGNAPILVDKQNGNCYFTGINWPVDYMKDFVNYKKGNKTEYNWTKPENLSNKKRTA